MALLVNGSTHLIPAYYSFYRPRKDERLSWPSWLTYSGWLIHISGHPSAAGRAQNRESSPAKDRRSTTVPRGTNFNSKLRSNSGQGLRHTISPTPPPSYSIRFVLLDIKGGVRNVSQSLHGTSNISSLSHSFRSSIFITLAASRTVHPVPLVYATNTSTITLHLPTLSLRNKPWPVKHGTCQSSTQLSV